MEVQVLSRLSEGVVDALLDGSDDRVGDDPYSGALRRYREDGPPREVAGRWRRAFQRTGPSAERGGLDVLRRLSRDLLGWIERPPVATAAGAADELPRNVSPIGGIPRDMPALELASDGAWRPSASGGSSAEAALTTKRQVRVPSLGSRYPDPSRPLPDRPAPIARPPSRVTE